MSHSELPANGVRRRSIEYLYLIHRMILRLLSPDILTNRVIFPAQHGGGVSWSPTVLSREVPMTFPLLSGQLASHACLLCT